MQNLLKGIHTFQTEVFRSKRDLFHKLSHGQNPGALFITCSDSRIDPNLLTQTEPGEIFVLRNAGNIIPPFPVESGEIATIEFAVEGLGIEDIIVCGHSDCGAMKGAMNPGSLAGSMPSVYRWVHHAKKSSQIVERDYGHLEGRERLKAAVQENVIVQIENLRTHAFIERRLIEGKIRLHGWVYRFETGEVASYDPETEQFLPLRVNDDLRPTYPRTSSSLQVRGLLSVDKENV